jgi:predicted transcriptional regulator
MTTDPVAADDPDLSTLVSLLDDEHVRTILAETSADPLSAAELAERCGVSDSAIYRRVDRLEAADLLDERTRPRSDGHHESVYVATLETFELTIRDGELSWTIERTETDVADELTRLWGKF